MALRGPTIRPFRPADGEALADFHRRAILATSGEFYTRTELESWAAGLRGAGYASAVQDGEIIEVALDSGDVPIAFCGRRENSVLGLYVDPDWQRHGLGGLLLARAEAAIGGSGYGSVTIKASISAVPFYVRHGYRVVESTRHTTRGGLVLASAVVEKPIVI
jgi:GNAT superfamily N-acetyltransferase